MELPGADRRYVGSLPRLEAIRSDTLHRAIVEGERPADFGPPPATGVMHATAVLGNVTLPSGHELPTRPRGIENALAKLRDILVKLAGRTHGGRG